MTIYTGRTTVRPYAGRTTVCPHIITADTLKSARRGTP